MRKNKIFWWIATIFWCIVIFYQSSKPAVSSDVDSLFIVALINKCLDYIFGSGAVASSNLLVRKSAHFTEYLILEVLLLNAIFFGPKLKKAVLLSLFTGIIYSVLDEFHQLFVPGRTPKLGDVIIDTAGIISGLIIMCLLYKFKNKNHSSLQPGFYNTEKKEVR